MTQTLHPLNSASSRSVSPDAAQSRADLNYAANRQALETVNPGLFAGWVEAGTNFEWLFGRDGSLTAMQPGEKWWGGCSLPRRVAEFMFKNLEVRGVVGCFLSPAHAAQVRVALDLLEPQQAILAIIPDSETLSVMLHCEDFSVDIKAHRLWFAAGEDWQKHLTELFVNNPGLPTPADFIRAIAPDNTLVDQIIAPAQSIFAAETSRRGEELIRLNSRAAATAVGRSSKMVSELCVVAPSDFRLWNDAPRTLAKTLEQSGLFNLQLFDSDDPASASPIELARQVDQAGAVVTANLARVDLPAVVPLDKPIITWITLPRIPAFQSDAPRDGLVIADPAWRERAIQMGWRDDRIKLARWPSVLRPAADGAGGFASLIADTHVLTPPKQVSEFSSHLLFWELVESELMRDPFVLKPDLDGYLNPRLARFQIDEANSNRPLFIERLIVPAYQHGLAKALIAQGLPLKLFGKGWEPIKEFAPYCAGPVTSRAHFEQIVDASKAIVHAWPISHAHPIDTSGRPVVRPIMRGVPASTEPAQGIPCLSAEVIRDLLA